MQRTQDALILQGGGALGAYELGVVRRLFEDGDFRPQVITGVSIGAVNAAVLAGNRDNPVAALEAVWDVFTNSAPMAIPSAWEPYLSLFGNPGLYRPRQDWLNFPFWTSFYDPAPLKRVLEQYVDFDYLNNSPVQVAVTAVNIRTGQIEVFDNSDPNRPLQAEHILASGSLPPGLPATWIGDQPYWDGGLFDNTPLAPAIERLDPNPEVRKRLFVIKLFPGEGDVPGAMPEVYDRILELIFSSKLSQDVETARRINDYVDAIRRIDEILDDVDAKTAFAIRRLPGYRRLQQYLSLQEIICIENRDPEIVSGPFDFSRTRIKRRMEAGYRDAGMVLGIKN